MAGLRREIDLRARQAPNWPPFNSPCSGEWIAHGTKDGYCNGFGDGGDKGRLATRLGAVYGQTMSKASNPTFHLVKSRRLFEEVCEQVRDQIASGALKPGDKLPAERDLALQFGISRSAVREALRSLEFAGLIRLQKGVKGGSFVLGNEMGLVNSFENMFSVGRLTLQELTEARIEIQDTVTRLAVRNRTAQDIKVLEKDVKRTKEALALSNVVSDPSVTQNFYALLAEATKNRVLVLLVTAIAQLVYQAIVPLNPPLNFDIVDVRTRFIAALKDRDEETARAIMREYLEYLHDYILSKHKKLVQGRNSVHAPSPVQNL